jgi:glycerol-1-phosphate dehydrogenase [NAD(P)+]
MTSRVENALKSASDTKSLLIGQGVLWQTAALFKEQFGNKKAIVIADETTYRIAGKYVSGILNQNGIEQDEPYVFSEAELHAEYQYIERLQQLLQATEVIPIAVGSGTINDLTKLSSHLTSRPYMIVGTAASMDGYTSFGASITANGAKQTFNCPAPKVVIADLDIIAKAPVEMTAAGYADLFSKVTAGADWIIADALDVEHIEPKAWSIVQDGLADALGNPQGVRNGDIQAIGNLVEGLMLGGFAMQWSKSSRPASGAEHYMSHLWDMEHHRYNGKYVSHGFQVSIGTLSILKFYEQFLKLDLSQLDVKDCCEKWMSLQELETKDNDTFGKTAFIDRILQESKAKYIDREHLAPQLEIVKNNWNDIKLRLKKQLIGFEEAQQRLQAVGAPTESEHIGISRQHLRETFQKAPLIRNRLTVLDLAQRACLTETLLNKIFNNNS